VIPSPTPVAASVIVRAKNRGHTIEATLRSLRSQTRPVEIVVVDSGSTDSTLPVAERYADRLIRIAPGDFSYGRALNIGAQAASAPIHFALSAHCAPASDRWVELNLQHYADDRVAATNGLAQMPDGTPGRGVFRPTLEQALRDRAWGFSNHASSWRASAWRDHPFREDLGACEDKEWSWRVLAAGWEIIFDPAVTIPSVHRRRDGVRATWQRTHREARALAELGQPPRPDLATAMQMWWQDFPHPSRWPRPVRRLSPHRLAEHWGAYAGGKEGAGRA
jgi:rhamnosyltransferase